MSDEEKMLLIDCILRDVRGDWSDRNSVKKRVNFARDVCKGLGGEFDKLADSCDAFLSNFMPQPAGEQWIDGRWFREPFPEGYIDMENLHHLERKFKERSEAFKVFVKEYINSPSYIFSDVEWRP